MLKRNIQVIVNLSLPMEGCIGLVYLFLERLLERLVRDREVIWTFQLTWFAPDSSESVIFRENKSYTDDEMEFLREFRNLEIKKGKRSCDQDVILGWQQSMSQMEGKAENQIVLYFSDYYPAREICLTRGIGARRVFLFTPEASPTRYHIRMVSGSGRLQSAMPVIHWPLEELREEFDDGQWENLMDYMNF